MTLLIKNGTIINPENKINAQADILINNGIIGGVEKNIDAKADEIIDAKGKIVMPGIVDIHVHFREPGREDKETVSSGTKAAAKGGVTSVLVMPNTDPAIDCVKNVSLLKNIIKKDGIINVFMAGSITIGRTGEKICDIKALKKSGVVAVSDDGSSVDKDDIMTKAIIESKKENIALICHSEDKTLSNRGVINLGFTSTRLGLRSISKESEHKRVERDIKLAEKATAPIHITHVSCKESVDIIAKAKKRGVKVTADTAPHYFTLCEEDLLDYNTNMKINPPLRTKEDRGAIMAGLKDGTLDVIASDHAPHTENEKDIEFDYAEFGSIGLETELALAITELINKGILDWEALVKRMCSSPAAILGLKKGTLSKGRDADIIIVDPDKEWKVEKKNFVSKSKNSAFLGRKLKGVVEKTIHKGKIVYDHNW